MGITIHYHGTMDDLKRVEEMEDRVTDLVFALGGRATIWRSYDDRDPSRVVRGLMIETTPGQDTLSLLVSPEGHLTPLFQIEDAEKSPFDEPPFCFVKTQFGSLGGHVAIVHLLDSLRQRFFANLEVSDEGEYAETRDINRLKHKKQFLDGVIRSMADGLREHGLSSEAAEDPNIILSRIGRIAMLVQRKIGGKTVELDCQETSAPGDDFDTSLKFDDIDKLEEPDELWQQSLSETPFDESAEQAKCERHPAMAQAREFLGNVMELAESEPGGTSFHRILCLGAGDMVGGLVQAINEKPDTRIGRAMSITQLKRALSGHAFARGAVFGLARSHAIDKATSGKLHKQLKSLLDTIHNLMANAWDENTFQ